MKLDVLMVIIVKFKNRKLEYDVKNFYNRNLKILQIN